MFQRPHLTRAMAILVVLPAVTMGCGREAQIPTAVSPLASDLAVANPSLSEGSSDIRYHGHGPRPAIISEAMDALAALQSGEQVYFQKWGVFTNVADADDAQLKLGVDLTEASPWWTFSITGASEIGFTAIAHGRTHTKVAEIVVALRYVRGQDPVWTVSRRHGRHGRDASAHESPHPAARPPK